MCIEATCTSIKAKRRQYTFIEAKRGNIRAWRQKEQYTFIKATFIEAKRGNIRVLKQKQAIYMY